jgi:hypothetical protein
MIRFGPEHSRASLPSDEPILLDVPRFEQPDDVTCGPTCLNQVYRYYGLVRPVSEVIRETPRNPDGGTQAVYLAISALKLGFMATIYSYNLRIFDPTWRKLDAESLIEKLRSREQYARSPRRRRNLAAYQEFLRLGGQVRFDELDTRLLVGILNKRRPILTGLSATYLYQTPREHREEYDDVRGDPAGHFVAICGYYPKSDRFVVRDPSSNIPFSRTGRYSVPAPRLIASILLGDVTYDAVLLVLDPGREHKRR